MPSMTNWYRRSAVLAVTVSASVLTFWAALALNPPPWKSSEFLAIGAWSVPLVPLMLAAAHFPRRWLRGRHTVLRAAAAVLLAVPTAILWTILAYYISGSWITVFDVHPLLCWGVGAIGGMLTAFFWPDMRAPSTVQRAAT